MAFKIDTVTLQQRIESASGSYDNLTQALTDAQTALNSALNAVGGPNTDIGKALNSVMGEYTEKQYTDAKGIIDNMATSVSTVKGQYEKANSDMIGFINALKNKDVPHGGGTNVGNSFHMIN